MPSYVKAYLGTTPLFTTTPTSSADWVRPADWLTLPSATANSVVGLYAVLDQTENYVTVQMQTADASTYTINWGDGNSTTAASNTIIAYNYDYNNAALNGTLSTRGYKQAIITITPQSGKVFTFCNIANKPTTPSLAGSPSSGWLDLNINLPNLTSGGTRLAIGANIGMLPRLLERVNIVSWGAINNTSEMFRNTFSLASLNETEWNFANITNASSMFFSSGIQKLNCENWDMGKTTSLTNLFRDCINLQSVKCSTWNLSACGAIDQVFMGCGPLEDVNISNWNVSNVQLFSYAFQGCRSLRNINVASWNTSKATTINNMFELAQSLTDVITTNWNLSACTNASNLFNGCGNLRKVGPLNLSNVANLGGSFAANCNSLANVAISGIKTSVNFSNCQMSATTLNTLYTNLSTVVGQTITVTGNYGTASDDPTIAQNKGWTVTG